jgi:ATP-dependent Clp protease adaptor protein ClpS
MTRKTKEKIESHEMSSLDSLGNNYLIIYNDDVNTFDYVINSLIEVCNHDAEQAEQCAYITHYKGKCDVKKGSFDFLKPMKDMLVSKGLTAKIE